MSYDSSKVGAERRSNHIEPERPVEVVPPLVGPRPPLPDGALRSSVGGPPARVPGRSRLLVPALAAVGGVIVGVAVGIAIGSAVTSSTVAAETQARADAAATAAEEAKSELFADAARKCGVGSKVDIEDDERTMLVDGEGEDFGSGNVTISELDCLIETLDAPAAVKARMYETRSLDGRQEASWGDLSASWSYHPDHGLDLIIELAD